MKQILTLLLFTLTLFANIPPQITYNDQHQPLVAEYENGNTILYDYDEVGNITKIETPQTTITKTYDALNRLKTITDSQGTVTYDYDAIGRQTKVTFSNGMTTEYSYDSRNRITNITHKKSDGTVLQSFAYTLDAVGNRTQIVENSGRTVDYTYNTVHQLTKEVVSNDPKGNNTTTSFAYDVVGNLLTKTIDGVDTSYSYNENDQLITQGSVTFTYDANGNLVAKDDTTYEYDDKNRLIKVITPTDTIEYSYDANDNRVAKTTSDGTTTYLIDANTAYAQVITETQENGTEIKYTYGNDLLSDGTHSFLTDALGSARGLVDSSEALTDSYAYTPYGELSSHDGNATNSFLFAGEQRDEETQDYYLRARYYSPNAGRFLSRDSYDGIARDPITLNHYLYTGSNPVMYVDPSGNIFGLGGMIGAMNLRVMSAVVRIQTSFVTVGSAGSAFVYLGKIVERQAGTIIQAASRALQYSTTIQRGVTQFGPGGRRVIDLLVRGKDAIARIEVKYQLPTQTGSALTRLIGQMQTSVANPGQTVLFSFKEPEIRTLLRVVEELERAGVPARSIQFVNGYRGLAQWFALYFHP